MKKTILIAMVLVLGLVIEVSRADFVFGEPVLFDEPVNSNGNEIFDCISADGLEIYIERPVPIDDITSLNWDLFVSTRVTTNDPWPVPVSLGPTINSSESEYCACLSGDGLELYFGSRRSGGHGASDLWMTTRPTRSDPWATPENLGPTINTSDGDNMPWITPDGLELYFISNRPGGYGAVDIWVATRASTNDEWEEPVNLGPVVNSMVDDCWPCLSPDGLVLFFSDWDSIGGPYRPGGLGRSDMWMTRRKSTTDPWESPVNLGHNINTSEFDSCPRISPDGSTLYFTHGQWGTLSSWDIWQASIDTIVDLNGDGIVDSADMCIMVGRWGTDSKLCDVGPMPWGDCIVDVQDLVVLAEHLFEEYTPAESIEVSEAEHGGQFELEKGQILVVTLESNPSTGYRWELIENNESVLEQIGQSEYKPAETSEPPIVGAGGWEIFRFKAVSTGRVTLLFCYRRPWEDAEPLKTFYIQVIVN